MFTTGGLVSLFPDLDHDDIHNFRRPGYLHPERLAKGDYRFTTKDFLLLRYVVPLWRQGTKPSIAFKKAEADFSEKTQKIWDAIEDYRERSGGYSPKRTQLQDKLGLSVPEFDLYLQALIDERELTVARDGGLTPTRTLQLTGVLKNTPQPHLAYTLLDDEKKMFLREQALSLYHMATQGLPDSQKIPVPVEPILEQRGLNILYTNLGRGCFAALKQKQVFLSSTLRRISLVGKKRFALTHEAFHDILGHGERRCALTASDNDLSEAEATYATVHYLMPLHRFDFVARAIADEIAASTSKRSWYERVASKYQVSKEVVDHCLAEHPQLQSVWQSIWQQRNSS